MNEKIQEMTNEHELYSKQKTEELISQAVRLREESYLSQSDVSTILGIKSHGGLSRIEKNKVAPGLDRFIKILSVYGYTLEIVEKEKPPKPI